jgi:hypothetical protein
MKRETFLPCRKVASTDSFRRERSVGSEESEEGEKKSQGSVGSERGERNEETSEGQHTCTSPARVHLRIG